MKKITTPEEAATNGNDNSTAAQRTRLLLNLLKRDSLGISTIQAREELDVMHPAGRVQELRNSGHNIKLVWSKEENAQGNSHRVGRYILFTGKYKGGDK